MPSQQEIDHIELAHECYLIEQAIDRAIKNKVNPEYIKELVDSEVERIKNDE